VGGVERLDDVTGLGHLDDVIGGRTRRRGVKQSGERWGARVLVLRLWF
jgi:hypothetical protein